MQDLDWMGLCLLSQRVKFYDNILIDMRYLGFWDTLHGLVQFRTIRYQ